jgi:chromatin remodeling complex protein RSC6
MDFTEDFADVLDNLVQIKKNITVIQNQIKGVEAKVRREQKKQQQKKQKQQRKKTTSGFAKPTKISDELCQFMGMEKGTELARTEVTKYLHEYIKKNALQVQTNKTLIVPDVNLKNLLELNDNESDIKEIHFFSLQKYMNKHFV